MITILPRLFCSLGVTFTLVNSVSADPPKKMNFGQFTRLVNESPFTIKPKDDPPPPRATPLERDWMLGSIRPNKDGYSVTLINKKDRKDRIRFIPGFSSGDFKLLKVEQDTDNSSNSRVQVSKGAVTAWLTYDEKLIQIRPAVASTKTSSKAKVSVRPGSPIPGKSSSTKTSRQRTVPKRK